jgi:hypothetical protein
MRCRTDGRDQSQNPLKTANLIIAYGLIVNRYKKNTTKLNQSTNKFIISAHPIAIISTICLLFRLENNGIPKWKDEHRFPNAFDSLNVCAA